MHLIVVRRDLTGFQHLHPTQGADGTWSTPVRLDEAGSYRLFADFSHEDTPQTLASDLRVDGTADLEPLPAPQPTATSDGGYDVRLDTSGSELHFAITRDGKPITTEPYLGAGGHLVALREGDLAFLHVHPERRRARLRGRVPRPPAATACSSSSSTRAASRPSPSRRWSPSHGARAPDHRHDLRLVREPDRAQPEQARRRHRLGQLRDREGDRRLRPRRGRARRPRRAPSRPPATRRSCRPTSPRPPRPRPTSSRRCAGA